MRLYLFILALLLTGSLVFLLDRRWGSIPPAGKFLSPQQGFWQNAVSGSNGNEELKLPGLKGKVSVYIDEREVPHVFAEYDEDVYMVQGYLHARYRLWQMDFQTRAAAGRISEIVGSNPGALRFDREQRRLGMVYAAEKTLELMESDPESKKFFDAYTAGVNAYIGNLKKSAYPVEYKLLDYTPEPWSNLKTALFQKLMTKDLAGFDRDIELTNLRSVFSYDEIRIMFPEVADSAAPIVPPGSAFNSPAIWPVFPDNADTLYFRKDTLIHSREYFRPDPGNGSNSWVVSGSLTESGAPILCNDPHLGLRLPSVWFEMQLTTPTMNAYGVTFPGAPSVIIGFNEHIAFGFTNAQRDVKDYYHIRFRDDSRSEYWYENNWRKTEMRVERISVRGRADFLDTVAYTVFGPVMYDHSFSHRDAPVQQGIALRWIAHEPSNEGAAWFRLNRARHYEDFQQAIRGFVSPAQNMTFASRDGDIAIVQQGRFPARWEGQGIFVMPGHDDSFAWKDFIPEEENPVVLNPPQGFIQSANQRPADGSYPYFIPGNYSEARGLTIHNRLSQMHRVKPQDMMSLQNDLYNKVAAMAMPLLVRNLDREMLSSDERRLADELSGWDLHMSPDSRQATLYQLWMDSLHRHIWADEFSQVSGPAAYPGEQTTIEILLRDSSFRFIDNILTPEVEDLVSVVTASFRLAAATFAQSMEQGNAAWARYKNVSIPHLTGLLQPFSRSGLHAGGWSHTINAIKKDHGPSWRMVVHLTDPVEAYGVYPGGQSGEPGSSHYDDFIDEWLAGKYFRLWVMKQAEENDSRIKHKIFFKPQ